MPDLPFDEIRNPAGGRRDSDHPGSFKRFGSPSSIISMLMLGFWIVSSLFKNASMIEGALPADRYFTDRKSDSIVRYYAVKSRDEQFIILQTQFADLKAELISERARTDSVIRVLRRTICRSDPGNCI